MHSRNYLPDPNVANDTRNKRFIASIDCVMRAIFEKLCKFERKLKKTYDSISFFLFASKRRKQARISRLRSTTAVNFDHQ